MLDFLEATDFIQNTAQDNITNLVREVITTVDEYKSQQSNQTKLTHLFT